MKRVLVVTLALVVVLFCASTAQAAEQTVTATIKINAPFWGKTVMGTVVVKYSGTAEYTEATWNFVGTIDGKAASASGHAEGRWNGKGYEGTLTSVDTWDMAGQRRPHLPLAVALLPGSGQTVWAYGNLPTFGAVSIPLTVQGVAGLPAPFQGDLAVSVTNAAGMEVVKGLQRTGAAPLGADLAPLALVCVGAGALIASRRWRRQTA